MYYLLVIWSLLSIFTAVRASQNLANGKLTSQSSTYINYGSSKAVDGCTSQFLGSDCCTHTDFLNTEAWWQVDLQQQSVIETVHIIYRTDGFLKRLAGFEIYLSYTADWRSGVRCYQDSTATLALVYANQNVPCRGVARYLTIYSDRRTYTYTWYSTWAFLELCEVYVNGCILGKYGNGHCNDDCLNCLDDLCHPTSGVCDTCGSGYYKTRNICVPCPTNCAGNTCGSTTGACSDGCLPGYSGIYCRCPTNCGDQTCSKGNCSNCNSGYYGPTCTSCPSGCNGDTCDKSSGICSNGCSSGFSGTYCNCPLNCGDHICPPGNCTNCNSGFYGPSCTPCPSGCHGNTCDKMSGTCSKCNAGFHGSLCDLTCPSNCNNNTCNQDTGQCKECTAGFHGSLCDQICPGNCNNNTCIQDTGLCEDCNDGYYGPSCTPCPIGCSTNTCDKTSGNCLQCNIGYHGNHCDQPCPGNCENNTCNMDGQCEVCKPGFHGSFCYQECPINCKNNICNMQDGQCSEREALVTEPESQAGIYAGAGVGALIVIGIVIATVAIVLRRRKLQPNRKMSTHFDGDLETTLSQPSPNNKPDTKSQEVSEPASSVAENTSNEYINVGDVNQEEVVYSNMDMSNGVTIEEIRAMIPKKKENEDEEFKKEFKLLPWGAVHPHVEGSKPLNKVKNRFKTTFPYDHSRVILDKIGNDPNSSYINANYIDGIGDMKVYVACQGPRDNTVDDFWRMVWQLNTGKIVMVTKLVEGGKIKCHQYWPEEGDPLETKHFNIRLDRERTYAFYVLRDISVTQTKTKEVRQIHQFHFIAWPDHGTPNNLELVLFHRRVSSYRTNLTGQMVVHCSAGIGRTGTFIALDVLSKEEKKTGRVDISQYIRIMRKDRMNMIQTHEQYIALHELLVEAADLADTLIPSSRFHDALSEMSPAGKPTNQTKLRKEFEHWLRHESETNDGNAVFVEKQRDINIIQGVDVADYLVSGVDNVRIFTINDWSFESLLPPSDSSLLQLLEQLDSRRRSDIEKPVVVMCLNGCTQSGLFCCLSNIRDQMKMDEEVDIFQTARQIQIRCPQALRNIEQFQYCYNFIGQYLDSTNVYIN